MEGPASDGETAPWCVPRRRSCPGQGDEAVRSASGTFGDAAEVRHHHQTKSDGAAGKVIAAGRPSALAGQAVKVLTRAVQAVFHAFQVRSDGVPAAQSPLKCGDVPGE